MNYALRIVAFVCTLTTFSLAGVTVSSPTSGSQDSSPVHFVASASGQYPIIAMKVYSDDNIVYSVDASSINAQVALPGGNHWIVVQAWDSHQNVYKAPGFWISHGVVRWRRWRRQPTYSMIQAMSGWQTCDTCAGSGSTSHSMTATIGSPSMTGNSTKYWLGGSCALP